jgi:hypothetical protein
MLYVQWKKLYALYRFVYSILLSIVYILHRYIKFAIIKSISFIPMNGTITPPNP